MIRVKIKFIDGAKEFYAEASYDAIGDGRLVYWTEAETGDVISYPVARITEIVEQDVEDRT